MFAAKTRDLGKPLMTAALAGEAAQGIPVARAASPAALPPAPSDSVKIEAHGVEREGMPLAAACENAMLVLRTPLRQTARARKLAEIDAFHKARPGRASLDSAVRPAGAHAMARANSGRTSFDSALCPEAVK